MHTTIFVLQFGFVAILFGAVAGGGNSQSAKTSDKTDKPRPPTQARHRRRSSAQSPGGPPGPSTNPPPQRPLKQESPPKHRRTTSTNRVAKPPTPRRRSSQEIGRQLQRFEPTATPQANINQSPTKAINDELADFNFAPVASSPTADKEIRVERQQADGTFVAKTYPIAIRKSLTVAGVLRRLREEHDITNWPIFKSNKWQYRLADDDWKPVHESDGHRIRRDTPVSYRILNPPPPGVDVEIVFVEPPSVERYRLHVKRRGGEDSEQDAEWAMRLDEIYERHCRLADRPVLNHVLYELRTNDNDNGETLEGGQFVAELRTLEQVTVVIREVGQIMAVEVYVNGNHTDDGSLHFPPSESVAEVFERYWMYTLYLPDYSNATFSITRDGTTIAQLQSLASPLFDIQREYGVDARLRVDIPFSV